MFIKHCLKLQISKKLVFDVAVIGAGICGCSTAYFLTQAGLSVALIDAKGIASGGSGAAGAFVSPKFVKSGPVKEVSEAAFEFSLQFYKDHFREFTCISELLHLANNDLCNSRVKYFKEHTAFRQIPTDSSLLNRLNPEARQYEHISLQECALVASQEICEAMAKDATFLKYHVNTLEHKNGVYNIDGIKAKTVVLCTGAHKHLIPTPYFTPRAIFGHRINIKTTTVNPVNIHQFVSISKSNEEGVIAIGATHDVHYNPLQSEQVYDYSKGRAELIEKATRTLPLENIELLKDYVGVRSASIDHLPLAGAIVNAEKTIEKFPDIIKRKKHNINKYEYYENLYMINGVGGYGFVLAPYLAQKLCKNITLNEPIDSKLLPSRFLRRWLIATSQ